MYLVHVGCRHLLGPKALVWSTYPSWHTRPPKHVLDSTECADGRTDKQTDRLANYLARHMHVHSDGHGSSASIAPQTWRHFPHGPTTTRVRRVYRLFLDDMTTRTNGRASALCGGHVMLEMRMMAHGRLQQATAGS